ncbi:MAG: sulfotransferase [Actinomycetota bacterium]
MTTTRPEAVTIEDLTEPTFPAEAQPIREAMAEMGASIQIEPDTMRDAAMQSTGLDDFGDPGYGERLDVLCRALRTEAGLSSSGRATIFTQLTQLLANRLLIEDLLKRHPEIHDERVERPIVIAGQPRTGTTHLHNLMSSDASLRSLPYWESNEPVLPEGEPPAPGEPDPRRDRTAMGLDVINTAMPYFKRMHEMTTDHVHEEIHLLAIDFSSMLFETMAPMPTWRDYYKSMDQTPIYGYLKKVLKVLQWLRGGERWLLKSPQHLEQFGPLMTTFPDATVVITHRDPVAITASTGTMLSYLARLNQDTVDPVKIGRYWAERIEVMARSCVDERELLPPAQSIDVLFHEFMADDVAMVERIYELAGEPWTSEVQGAMGTFMEDHPRGRHGTVRYDLEVLGLDEAERRRALAFYVERFGLREERVGG